MRRGITRHAGENRHQASSGTIVLGVPLRFPNPGSDIPRVLNNYRLIHQAAHASGTEVFGPAIELSVRLEDRIDGADQFDNEVHWGLDEYEAGELEPVVEM